MLIKCVLLITSLAVYRQISPVSSTNIEKRIAGLKEQLRQEIEENQKQRAPEATTPFKLPEYYDLVVTESETDLIKPIIEYYIKPIPQDRLIEKGNLSTHLNFPDHNPKLNKTKGKKSEKYLFSKVYYTRRVTPAANVFYHRRLYLDEEARSKPQKWTHCLDLLTPRLKGYKDDWKPKQITHADGEMRRLAHLLSLNTSDYTKEEIISILYQISNIRMRIFQWDYTALTAIFNIIIKGPVHNFRTLKNGLKSLFKSWHLDTTMVSTFLKQTRIFRPPCIQVSEYEGSTKTTGGYRISKPHKSHRKKETIDEDHDDDCDD